MRTVCLVDKSHNMSSLISVVLMVTDAWSTPTRGPRFDPEKQHYWQGWCEYNAVLLIWMSGAGRDIPCADNDPAIEIKIALQQPILQNLLGENTARLGKNPDISINDHTCHISHVR